jgi:hypothetical protein
MIFHHRGTESTEDIKEKAEKINKFSEALAKVTSSVIPGRAPLARNDDFLLI